MRKLTIMTPTDGDKAVVWDETKTEEREATEAKFTELIRQNYAAYRVDPATGNGEQIREFDPDADEILMAVALVGG